MPEAAAAAVPDGRPRAARPHDLLGLDGTLGVVEDHLGRLVVGLGVEAGAVGRGRGPLVVGLDQAHARGRRRRLLALALLLLFVLLAAARVFFEVVCPRRHGFVLRAAA